MKLPDFLRKSPPPAAEEAETLADAVVDTFVDALPDSLDTMAELETALFIWMRLSLATLILFLVVHATVRIIRSVIGDERPARCIAGPRLVLHYVWACVVALFPSGRKLPVKEGVLGKLSSALSTVVGFVAMDLAISFSLPIALGHVYGMEPLSLPTQYVLACLIGARIVNPLSTAIHRLCGDAISEWVEADKEAHGDASGSSYDHLSIIPEMLVWVLWAVWAAALLAFLGIDVSRFWQSLGASGLLIGLALQHYAADAVAGFTLLADGRFKLGECITINSGDTFTVRQVGILQTRCTTFNTGHALSVPNSVLAKASITNEDRIAKRRITPSVVIDANTPAAQIAPLPIALREAARAAMKEAGLEESVIFSNSEKGDGAELLAADKDGLHFVIVINVVLPSNYLTLWKRVHTAAMCGMLGELQKRGIKLGRRRVDMEPAK